MRDAYISLAMLALQLILILGLSGVARSSELVADAFEGFETHLADHLPFREGACTQEPYNVGAEKQLFIDDSLIDWNMSKGVGLAVNPPQKTGDQIIVPTEPWEEFCVNAWVTVMEDEGLYRMWYEAYSSEYGGDLNARLCYAESTDGINWRKPGLGIVEFRGNKENNIVFTGRPGLGYHGGTVFKDPIAEPNERYKMVYLAADRKVHGAVSPDGLHWTQWPYPILNVSSDTQTVCFYDESRKKYVIFCRLWSHGWRVTGRSESDSFFLFPLPTEVLRCDEQDPPATDMYNSAAVKYPYASNSYFILTSLFDRRSDTLQVYLATSRDGVNWVRPQRIPFITRGPEGSFDSECVYANVGHIRKGNEIWIYYTGFDLGHGKRLPQIRMKQGQISRAVLRLDGYVSVDAQGEGGGTLTTLPLVFSGGRLELNVKGDIRVALLDESGRPIPGFRIEDCDEVNGDFVNKTITWNGLSNLAGLAGRKVRLQFKMEQGSKLYAFQFAK